MAIMLMCLSPHQAPAFAISERSPIGQFLPLLPQAAQGRREHSQFPSCRASGEGLALSRHKFF